MKITTTDVNETRILSVRIQHDRLTGSTLLVTSCSSIVNVIHRD